MNRKQVIEKKLSVLSPHLLEITDESAKHSGHTGNPDNKGDTHFTIKISATKLNNLSRVKQHRIINDLLKTEFTNGLHALSINVI